VTQEFHERAKGLIASARVEGISGNDREWLEQHLQSCVECAACAGEMENTLRSLRQISIQVNPELVARTRRAVHLRASELHAQKSQWIPLWMSCALSWVLGGLTLPLVWQAIKWVESYLSLPSPVGIFLLMLWWALPTLVVAAFLGTRKTWAAGRR
jgi:hypothetical protein